MAAEPSFSRITVTPDEEDVVIQAGIRSDACASSPGASFEDAGASEGAPAPSDVVASVSGRRGASLDVEGKARGGDAPADEGLAAGAAASRPASAGDNYRATTLEDIESSKMPVMQKVIIVVAVIAIVAFAVWYVLAG